MQKCSFRPSVLVAAAGAACVFGPSALATGPTTELVTKTETTSAMVLTQKAAANDGSFVMAQTRGDLRGAGSCIDGSLAAPNCQLEGGSGALGSNSTFMAADNFRVAQNSVLNGICFIGVWSTQTPPADNLTITIHSDGGDIPGAAIQTFTQTQLAGRVTRVLDSSQAFGLPFREFEYVVNFPTPINLNANTCYWISIRNNVTSATFYWRTGLFADGKYAQDGAAPQGLNGFGPEDARCGSDLSFCLLTSVSPVQGIPLTTDPVTFRPNGCSALPAPQNDDCNGATLLTVASGATTSVLGDTCAATPEEPPPPYCYLPHDDAPGLWYRVVGNGNVMNATTCPPSGTSTFDTVLAVFDGRFGCSALTCVNGNDDMLGCANNDVASSVTWCAAEGVEYYIYVRQLFSGDEFTLTVQDLGEPNSCDVACQITPPTGAVLENEANCGLDAFGGTQINLGCSGAPQGGFTEILLDTPIAATAGTSGTSRDVDWFRYIAPAGTDQFTVEVASELPVVLFVEWAIDDTGGPTADPGTCDTSVTQFVIPIVNGCFVDGATLTGVTPGDVFYVAVLPSNFETPICDGTTNDYVINITAEGGGGGDDCNNNSVPDADEILANPALDCFAPGGGNGDGILDQCQCIADFNANGAVDASDITAFLSTWFADRASGGAQTDADINCSGTTDASDITGFLNFWFEARSASPDPLRGCP